MTTAAANTLFFIAETREGAMVPTNASANGDTTVYVCKDSERRTQDGPVALRDIRGKSVKTTLADYARGEVEGLDDDELGWLTAYTVEEWADWDGTGACDVAIPFEVKH